MIAVVVFVLFFSCLRLVFGFWFLVFGFWFFFGFDFDFFDVYSAKEKKRGKKKEITARRIKSPQFANPSLSDRMFHHQSLGLPLEEESSTRDYKKRKRKKKEKRKNPCRCELNLGDLASKIGRHTNSQY